MANDDQDGIDNRADALSPPPSNSVESSALGQLIAIPLKLWDSLSVDRIRQRLQQERRLADQFEVSSNRIVAGYIMLYLAVLGGAATAYVTWRRPEFDPHVIGSASMVVLVILLTHIVIATPKIRLTSLMGYLVVSVITGLFCILAIRNAGIIAPGILFVPPLAAAAVVLLKGALRLWCILTTSFCLVLSILAAHGYIGVPTTYTHDTAVEAQSVLMVLATIFLGSTVALFVLDRDITHRRYERQNADLAAASRSRSDFLTMMSHELRTPMNAILGSLEILKRSDDPASQAEMIGLIEDAGYALTTQLDDLLDQSRIEAGRMELSPRSLHLCDLIDRTLHLWQARADDKGLRLVHDNDDCEFCTVRADRVRLQQVLSNLVSNAIKFTAHGEVRVQTKIKAQPEGDVDVSIVIDDTGPGIPSADLEQIFEPFYRSGNTSEPGNGLGLSISRRLIGLMGGTLDASIAPTGGARFSIQLTLPRGRQEERTRETPDATSPETVSAGKVLCVDDHPANLRIVTVLLDTMGYETHAALSGEEALQLCQNNRFDVIVMDVLMPGLDGMETTKRIRSDGGLNIDTPVVALTANVMPEQVEKYKAAGMNSVVAKPIDARILLTALEQAKSVSGFTDLAIKDARAIASVRSGVD